MYTIDNDDIFFRQKAVGDIGRKGFLKLIKSTLEPYTVALWQKKLNTNITEYNWKAAGDATSETKLKMLHWKILHNIYPTNIMLKQMNLRTDDLCEWCQCKDVVEHVFFECEKVKVLWSTIESFISTKSNVSISLDASDVLLGINKAKYGLTKTVANMINHIIILGKLSISKWRYGNTSRLVDIFQSEVRLRKVLNFD